MSDDEFVEDVVELPPSRPVPEAGIPRTAVNGAHDIGGVDDLGRTEAINGHAPEGAYITPALSDRPAEAHVLSCLLLAPAATLDPEVFYYPEHRLLYLSIRRLLGAGKPVELATIAADLSDHGQFERVGGWPFLFGIESRDSIPTTLHLAHYTDRVQTLAERRRARSHAEATMEALANGGPLPRPMVSAPRQATENLLSRRITLASQPKEPTTRLFLANKPIATPGNLTTIISRAKTGKTATIGGVVAAIVGAHYDRSNLDTLGFTAPHTNEAVILIDTEQSPYDAFVCHQRAFARAGQQQDVEWLHHYALVGYGAKQIRDALPGIIAAARAQHGAIFTIILDGVADLVASVNDEAECNETISWLRAIAVTNDCPIICVIHSNEGIQSGDDGRGHLGKQLIRKAESNLVLKKDGEITTITSEKQRKAPITEKDGISFQWSEEAQRHVSCKLDQESKRGPKKTKFLQSYLSVFETTEAKAATFPQIHKKANAKYPVSRNTFWALIEEGVQTGEIQVSLANPNEPRYWVR
jgi:hypothetical protein